MPSIRSLLTYAAALVLVFVAATVIGYAYEHDPERDLVEVVVDRSVAAGAEDASGTVAEVNGDVVRVEGALGTVELTLGDVVIEELRPLADPADLPPGTKLNLGGERAATERVIRGVVLIGPEVSQ